MKIVYGLALAGAVGVGSIPAAATTAEVTAYRDHAGILVRADTATAKAGTQVVLTRRQ